MKKILLSMLLVLLSSIAVAAKGSANYLFMQIGTDVNISKNTNSTYTLSFNSARSVGYFTDRPKRVAGLMSLTDFLALWNNQQIKNNFNQVPPNAAIAVVDAKGKQQNFIAALSNPQLNNNTLTYTLQLVSKKPINPGPQVHINLFFDDIHWNPGGFGS